MKLWVIFVALIAAEASAIFSPVTALSSPLGEQSAPSDALGAINVTSDSAPGWLPSASQRQEVLEVTSEYFSALDGGQYERAYAMMTDGQRSLLSLVQFSQNNREYNERFGALKRRLILKVTWTKDSASAPYPGVYAAIDIATYFTNVDRHCGYVVLYQRPSGGSFEIMRQESNFIDNTTAQNIERQQSRAALDRLWSSLSANCPNYALARSSASSP